MLVIFSEIEFEISPFGQYYSFIVISTKNVRQEPKETLTWPK